MPHTQGAKKNLRKIAKRRLHNRTVKKGVKTELKGFQTALDGTMEESATQFKSPARSWIRRPPSAALSMRIRPPARNRSWPALSMPKKPRLNRPRRNPHS